MRIVVETIIWVRGRRYNTWFRMFPGLKINKTLPLICHVSVPVTGLIVHEGAAVYNVFMRWRAVNLHWDVQSYDKAKDMEESSTGHSSLGPRTLWLPLVTFGPNGPLHPTQLGPQPWTCLCLAPFCPGLFPQNNLSQDSDSGEVVIRVTSV